MGETYYDVLGVDPDASAEEIRAAYRERVLETHPDQNDAPDAAEQFKRVSTAKSVLTDGDERARYDRLGHDAYVRLAERSTGASGENDTADSSSNGSAGDTSSDSSDETGATGRGTKTGPESGSTSGSRRGATSGRRTGSRTGSNAGAATGTRDRRSRRHRTRTGSDSDRGAGESHHARQRKRRRQQRARQRATSGWSLGTESAADAAGTSGSSGGPASHAGADTASERGAGDDEAFRYAVHDWTDDVELEWEDQSVEYSAAVTIGCCWLLYPILVVSILTSAFPILVNGIVFACTLGVVGYTLTRPRIAAVLFGSWSVLFPIGIELLSVSQFSLTGLVALGFAWVPFGYAVALWWALRP